MLCHLGNWIPGMSANEPDTSGTVAHLLMFVT
jgi:hypothetical protein